MIWFVVQLYRHAIAKIGNWSEDINGAIVLAAMLGITGILVHSFVDFNLQIPANAALFYVLCGLAASEPSAASLRFRKRPSEDLSTNTEQSQTNDSIYLQNTSTSVVEKDNRPRASH